VVLFVIRFFVPIESGLRPSVRVFTYGFRDRITSKADIPAIRAWLRTLDKEDFRFGQRLSNDEWPVSLRRLKPPSVYLCLDKNDNPFVRITWGGGFFHWGMVIGMEDMEILPIDINFATESWLLVEPGVYVFDW
jgi:hypothetical protein